MDILIEPRCDGMSVSEFLRLETGMSNAQIKHIKFLDNGIMLGDRRVTVREKLRAGETLSVLNDDSDREQKIIPSDIPVNTVYEDPDVTVPDKPPMMPTHPSHGHYDDTLANALAFRYRNDSSPFIFRPVNRLDRNTSGLVLVARNRLSASKLFSSMRNGEIHKEYIAVLDGIPSKKCGEIETYMRRTAQSIIVREVCGAEEGADYALTRYRVLCINEREGMSVVAATPVTGRTHQLRVHFAHIDCPITGDDMYGSASEAIGRHALHAARLSFPHPRTGERINATSPLWADMQKLVEKKFDGLGEIEKFFRCEAANGSLNENG